MKTQTTVIQAPSCLPGTETEEIASDVLNANKGGFFTLGGKVYEVTGVYGQCFLCYEVDKCAYSGRKGKECVISARMVIGTVELTAFQD